MGDLYNYVKSKGYVSPKAREYEITTSDGKSFGKVGYGAYSAILENKLDSYKPKNEEEKRVLSDFKTYAENKAREERVNSNPVFKRYNIDPDNFTQKDFLDWLENNNMEVKDADSSNLYYGPKVEGGFLGIGGKKLATQQQIEDADVLYQLQANNYRKKLAQKDNGPFVAALSGLVDGSMILSGTKALVNADAKKDYERAGFDPETFVDGSQTWSKTNGEHKVANILGNIAGSIPEANVLGKVVGAGVKGVKWIANAPAWIKNAVVDGITFGVTSGTKTALHGGTFEDVIKNAARGGVSAAAGGAASSVVDSSIVNGLLTNPKYADKFWGQIKNLPLTNYVRTGVVGLADAAGDALVDDTLSAITQTEQRSSGDVLADFAVTLAYGMLNTAARSKEITQDNAAYIKSEAENYVNDYKALNDAATKTTTPEGFAELGRAIIERGNRLKSDLQTRILTGQQDLVDSVSEKIEYVNGAVREKINEVTSQATGASESRASNRTNTPSTDTAALQNGGRVANEAPAQPVASAPIENTGKTISAVSVADTAPTDPPGADKSSVSTPAVSAPMEKASAAGMVSNPSSTPAVPVVDVSFPVTPASASDEVGEITHADEIIRFTPESASSETQRLENILIAQGADDASRQEIVGVALEIEKALSGSNKTIRSVFNDVSKITSGAVTAIKNKAGVSGAYWKLFGENFKAIPTGSVSDNVELITEYATAYTEALKNGNPEKYNAAIVSADGKDLSAELPQTIMQNVIPANVQNAGAYRLVATQIKNIISDVDVQLASERTEIYGVKAENGVSAVENTGIDLQNAAGNGTIKENFTGNEVHENANIGEYDSGRETQLRADEKTGIYGRGDQENVAGYQRDTEGNQGTHLSFDSQEYSDGGATNGKQQGIVRNVFHGTPYRFSTFLKSYVDLGIHFGTEAQARVRAQQEPGRVDSFDLILKNPLVTEDVFGERTPEKYAAALLENSKLSADEKRAFQKAFADFLKSDIKQLAAGSLEGKLLGGKYQVQVSINKDSVHVGLALLDDVSNVNTIPMLEIIDKNELTEILGFKLAVQVLKNGTLSKEANEELAPHIFQKVLPFEIQFLKLRKIEDILQSFGYDGFAYKNENEGDGWSYAVFDDSQIVRNTGNNSRVTAGNAVVVPAEDTSIGMVERTARTDSVKDAQTYNVIISNLKRKGEELGLLDRNFYVKLQEVEDFYNPTTSDKALISSEFQRVFAGNTDPLVADWLKAIETIPANVAEHNTTEPATEKSNSKTVTFIQKGDFYNVYGADAELLTEKFGIKNSPTELNGKTVPYIGVSPDVLSAVTQELSKLGMAVSVKAETPTVTRTNEQNMPVTDENTPANEIDETTPVGQLLEDYNDAVDNILSVSDKTAKEFADKRVAVEVLKNTPTVILDNVEDARNLKVIINYNKLYLAVRKDGVFKGHYHNLGAEIAKKLPEFLQSPDAIIQLANGRLNLFATVETEKGNNGIVSVELNSTKDINGKYEDYNVVVTMFSSDDNYAQNLISGDGVTEKYKREDLSQVNPQLYKWLAIINDKSSVDTSISQEDPVVKNDYTQNEEKHTSDEEKRSLATAENANALSSTPETTSSTASNNIILQDNDIINSSVRNDTENDAESQQKDSTPSAYDVAYFDDLGASIRKGESVLLKDVRTAVDAILLNHGEAIKAELSQLKNDELKKHLSVYDRGRITKKAEMVDSIYTDMLSSLYYALSGKETITYIYDGTGFDAQLSKMLFDISRELTEETFSKRLAENAEKYKKQLAAREEKLAKVKNPQTLEDYAYKKRYFGLSDEETIQYENLYAEERRKAREDKKAAKTTKDTSGADAFFANADNYTIEKTTHTKTGEDVWVVRPANRLETEEWKQLNEQMKALGGSYWRGNQGWNFKKDPTAALTSTEEAETETAKGSTNAEKVRAIAEGMQKAIDDKFRDRLTNTAKRAREAASAEAEGERLKRLQDTINNIADALENGENTLLDKIDSKAQVETLMSMLRTGRRNRISETMSDITYDERLQEQDKPYSNDDAKYAEYPLTKLHESAITEYIRAAEGKTGYKQITNRLKKSLKSVKNGYVAVDAQMYADIDKIVQNLSTYRADFWNNGVSERKRLARMGIENVVELRAYLREFIKFLPGKDADAERQRNIKAKERQLANAKIEGFFPTPKAIVEKMLDEADIKPGEKVLEPSAGKGNIADAIRESYPDNALDVVEWNASLNELLSEKGHNVVGVDFLQHSGEYDKIIMNPPFEKGQDIDHIKHAYSLLNDGGRVVCIMSEGPFFRSDKKATEFREWLDSLGGVSERLPEGAFKASERSTGVNTRLVIIDKVSDTKVRYTLQSDSDSGIINTNNHLSESGDGNGNFRREEKTGDIGGGTGRVSARLRDKGRRNSSNTGDLPDRVSALGSEEVGEESYGARTRREGSSKNGVAVSTPSSASEASSGGRETTDGERFLEAIKAGDDAENRKDLHLTSSDYPKYTYKALTSKADMPVTMLDDIDVFDKNGRLNRDLIVRKGIENVRAKSNPRNTNENTYVYIPDVGRDVLVTKDSLRHGLARKAENTAKATMKIGDILENSIRVNELLPRKSSIGGYVLMGAATDNQNNYYPVRIVVNNFSIEEIEVLDVLYAINAKKRRTSPQTRQGIVENSTPLIKGSSSKEQSSNEAELPADAVPPIKAPSLISIAELLELVKNDFSDVLSNDVLQKLNVPRAKSTLSESVRYSQDKDSGFTPTNMVESRKGERKNEGRDLLSDGNSKRGLNARSGKQAKRISEYQQKLEGKTAAERRRTAAEIRTKGLTEEKIIVIEVEGEKVAHKYTLVKPEAYNEDMQTIVVEAKEKGKEVGFFLGHAVRQFDGKRDFLVDGIYYDDGTKILLRYDGVYPPQALFEHEKVHDEWDQPEMQRAKDIILGDISDTEKKKILSNQRYKDYLTLYDGKKEKVWEEFIADVFAGMNDYTADYMDVITDYAYDGKVIDRYNPAEYNTIIDAGGVNEKIVDGLDYSSSYSIEDYLLDDGELTRSEWNEFYNSLGALERGMWFPRTADGDYIFETDDKLIFTDGDYLNPKISSVVVFEGLSAEEIEYGKEAAYRAAQRNKTGQECYEAIGYVLGQEYVTRTNPYADKAYQRGKNGRRKGRYSVKADSGIEQKIDVGGNATVVDAIGFGNDYNLIESGGNNGIPGNNEGRVRNVSGRNPNKARRDTSLAGDISVGESTVEAETDDTTPYGRWKAGKRGNEAGVDSSAQSSIGTYASGGTEAIGRRFLEAINRNDEKTARELLDQQAERNGYEPIHLYHGTREGRPFDSFDKGAAIWVTAEKSYAEEYPQKFAEEKTSLEYLFTEPDSGVFDLYGKKGSTLDLGDIETQFNTPDEVIAFGRKIGFSTAEILRCWNAGRKFESNEAWTLSATREFADIAREKGYDSLKAVEADGIETFGMLYSENLKSAKLLTYDDAGGIIPLEQRFDDTVDNIRYTLSSYDNDAEELTPERKKEIFEQFEKDRAGVDKPTQKQLWGERAAWVAHNMTRVFPNIPERGERGTFFAEFRKSMIQWKNLPTTASFMVQDKLNKMAEGLTPEEFKTFSELVYFLDLQEEAQIQKERGYTEILLPNEITPGEVDAIVKVLNEEATENVQQALIKRQNIWEALKSQYIDLNRYIGFDTDGKFKRKNYYHHQVIEYMNDGSKGTGSREIGIKAGRGWLKERQGSTKAINTDFLAVEYKAMLQMQYDVYIAETLGRIKQQYDIKPQLEDEAFKHNKNALNEIIRKEAVDKDGHVMLDSKGKPDSETYRQQQWYNSRIMFGFSGLFDLAERNELSDFGGEYASVIGALKRHDLNVPGLYKYVGIVASTDTPDNATDAQEQAVLNARTVLKYTSQKKAWIQETLGDDYQTWETLAKSMGDTHTIHQPRRGNYFYTKTVIDEDAFNKAHNEMVLSLASGEIDLGNVDLNKLFTQYADTVRLTGAAYEQWVLPNEIVTTMDEIANPKQATEGAKVARGIVSAWKGWATSVNPLRTVKFGLRNLFGDLDAVIAGNPKVTMYSKKAVQDIYQAMRHKNYSSEYMEWIERGGYTSMIFANEMDSEMQDKLFSHLKEKQGVNIFKIPVKLFEKYQNGVENVHNFREAVLRYSSYLYFKEAIRRNGGVVKDYVSSNKYIVRGLNSLEDKAYQLSKDLLGAYDEVGKMGQTLRRYWIPFYSFTETNLKRYYRMFENIITSDDKIPKKAGKLLLKGLMVNMLGLLIAAWNKLVMKEEDEKLPPTARNVPHITLGKIGDDIYAFRQLGSFSEILEWFGLEDYKWSSEDLTAPLDKAWGMVTPFLKMPIELVSGLNFYPSLTQPRAIRDKWQHFFNSFGVDDIYNEVTGKPTKGADEILKGSVVYNYDYKESAYYEILDIKREYQGKTDNTIYGTDAKSNALYYMKTAVRYKDKEAALKYLDEYFENGGTAKGIKQSFATLNPMHGFTGKDTAEKGEAFIASLTEDEKEKLKIAQDYYENDLMLPENVLALLGKKGITVEEAKNVLKGYINAKCK